MGKWKYGNIEIWEYGYLGMCIYWGHRFTATTVTFVNTHTHTRIHTYTYTHAHARDGLTSNEETRIKTRNDACSHAIIFTTLLHRQHLLSLSSHMQCPNIRGGST